MTGRCDRWEEGEARAQRVEEEEDGWMEEYDGQRPARRNDAQRGARFWLQLGVEKRSRAGAWDSERALTQALRGQVKCDGCWCCTASPYPAAGLKHQSTW